MRAGQRHADNYEICVSNRLSLQTLANQYAAFEVCHQFIQHSYHFDLMHKAEYARTESIQLIEDSSDEDQIGQYLMGQNQMRSVIRGVTTENN